MMNVRRATVTIPDDLEAELEAWLRSQPAPPSLARVMQSALRAFLRQKRLEALQYRPSCAPLSVTVARSGSGHADASVAHDAHLAARMDGDDSSTR